MSSHHEQALGSSGKKTLQVNNYYCLFVSFIILYVKINVDVNIRVSFKSRYLLHQQFYVISVEIKKEGYLMDVFCCSHTSLHSCPGNEIQSFFCSQKKKLLSALFSVCHRCSNRYTLLKKEGKKR